MRDIEDLIVQSRPSGPPRRGVDVQALAGRARRRTLRARVATGATAMVVVVAAVVVSWQLWPAPDADVAGPVIDGGSGVLAGYRLDGEDVVFDADQTVATLTAAGASEAEVELVADGRLTFDEYRSAMAAAAACARSQGASVGDGVVTTGPGGYRRIELAIPDTALATFDGCYDTQARNVDIIWQLAHWDTSQQLHELAACLQENTGTGFDPNDAREVTDAITRAHELKARGGHDCLADSGVLD